MIANNAITTDSEKRRTSSPRFSLPVMASVEAVEKPIFHPEMVVKMAQDFLRHLHFIN